MVPHQVTWGPFLRLQKSQTWQESDNKPNLMCLGAPQECYDRNKQQHLHTRTNAKEGIISEQQIHINKDTGLFLFWSSS